MSWATIGQQGTTNPPTEVNSVAIAQVLRTASNQVDKECGQTLRSMVVAEAIRGPSHRMGFLPGSSVARALTSWHPIRRVLQGAIAPVGVTPASYNVIPAGNIFPESGPMGFFGTTTPEPYHGGNNSLLISAGFINWGYGRYGTELWATFLNGWPHGSMAVGCSEGVSTLEVDEICGMVGSAPWINDGPSTEQVVVVGATPATPGAWSAMVNYPPGVMVTSGGVTYQAMMPSGPGTQFGAQTPGASAPASTSFWSTTIEPAGPGVLTLADGVENAHGSGATVTAMPEDVLWACALFAKAEGLQRGTATLTTNPDGGPEVTTLEKVIESTYAEAVARLADFRRIL